MIGKSSPWTIGGSARRIWQSRFARNIAVVATGTAAAQAISVAVSPLITRIYGPEAFGILGTFIAIVSVAAPVAHLAYPMAIVLPREDQKALDLARLSAYLAFMVSLVVVAALWVGGDWLVSLIGVESMGSYVFFIPIAMLFSAWSQIGQQWLIRKREFGFIARLAVTQSLVMNGAKVGIGWLYPYAGILIAIAAVSDALYTMILLFGARCRFRPAKNHCGDPTTKGIKELAYLYRDFPIYRTPQNFINAISQSLPVLMLAALFSPTSAGLYTLAKMVMGVPSTLVGKAVSDVFYPKLAEGAYAGSNMTRMILESTGIMMLFGAAPFGLVILFGPWLFGFIFGEKWILSGEYARWLAVFFLFNFVNKPSVAAVPVLGLQRGLLFYEMFSTVGKLLGLLLGFYWFQSDIWAVALFSIIGAAAYSLMMFWIVWQSIGWSMHGKAG